MNTENIKEVNYFFNGLKIIFFKSCKGIGNALSFCKLKNILCFTPYFLAIVFTFPVLLFEGIRVLGGLPEEKQTGPIGYVFKSVFGESYEEKSYIIAIAIVQTIVICFIICMSFVCMIVKIHEYFAS